ncbi:PLP-dependent transferase [Thozetella sp. PMI_491]|nr:PLP-dependent transferase [Thozetella sp. PMI_491]
MSVPAPSEGDTAKNAAGAPSPPLADEFALYRKLVPLVERPDVLYLDSASQPPSNLIVANALNQYTHDHLHNPNAKNVWKEAAEDLRGLLGRYINADPEDIAITSDTTEAGGCFTHSLDLKPGDNVVVVDSEFPHLPYTFLTLRERGIEVRQIPTIPEAERTGQVTAFNADTFRPYVDDRTRCIGISTIMFHSGQWNDVAAIAAEYRPRGIHVFADVTQQIGFAALDVKALGVSAAGFSFFKGFASPRGIAALYVDREVVRELRAPPIASGRGVANARADRLVPPDEVVYYPNARRFEHENLNYAGAVAAKAWLSFYLDTIGPQKLEAHLHALGDALRATAAELSIRVVGPEDRAQHAPHLYILELLDPGWKAYLEAQGVWITHYRLGVRVAFHFYNNLADVERLGRVLEMGLQSGLSRHAAN